MIVLMATRERLSSIDPWLEPYSTQLQQRVDYTSHLRRRVLGESSVEDFALGHLYFGLHRTDNGWVLREWAPNATQMYLVGEMTDWKELSDYKFQSIGGGKWELVLPATALTHGDSFKLRLSWPGGGGDRIPSYATYVVQDRATHDFAAQVWNPEEKYAWNEEMFTPSTEPLLIYEAHVGMATSEEKVGTYLEFIDTVLPRVKAGGYNAIQLMAVQEHPYYGSFGYHVSNFFAASSRFGTPDDLKRLVDAAHQMGIAVILDIVHSHAVKNEAEGLSRFDGTLTQYFHEGPRGNHEQWDSRTFDYGKPEVLHFLLSNCRFWLDEYHFDGFRFDGVTSMLYSHHGLGVAFGSYDDYFKDTDPDALAYLTLANELIHQVKPTAITIAEEMSGMPGIAGKIEDGGIGFDYRLNMGIPDLWIRYIKERRDEDWNMSELLHELTSHRAEERTINYAESHDQALVGDKTIMFRLADKEMYDHMMADDPDVTIERAVALHKMIRLLTAAANSGGYLNFMGNEFGHPEWIDFPREGNDWSYKYARRQWQLAIDPKLKYQWLDRFDQAMIKIISDVSGYVADPTVNDLDHVVSFVRGDYVFVFNFHPDQSFEGYGVSAPAGSYDAILSSDDAAFGGQDRVATTLSYESDGMLRVYMPARTAAVYRRRTV